MQTEAVEASPTHLVCGSTVRRNQHVMERFLIDFAGNGSVKRSELTQNNRIF